MVLLVLNIPCRADSAAAASLLAQIKAIQKEGIGNSEAGKAWRELVELGPMVLPATLAALDGADAIVANWLRAAVDAIAEREVKAGRPLPVGRLEAFIKETGHSPAGRRLAYEWLVRVDAAASDRLLPGMLQDPSVELRRDAVARILDLAQKQFDKGEKEEACSTYRKALAGARDRDQVELIARQLKTLGVSVDLTAHFGFIRQWHLLAPFDNTDRQGYARIDPPEKAVDLKATYQGKKGAELRWTSYTTPDPYGMVDLNKALGKQMGVIAYAYTLVDSPAAQEVEIRLATQNAVKFFLNGRPLYAKEEYHHGLYLDQHVGRGTLVRGRNSLLVKVCQNEQTEAWAQTWQYQLRICDAVGGGIPVAVVSVQTLTDSPTHPK
jgi:hypothetical protein